MNRNTLILLSIVAIVVVAGLIFVFRGGNPVTQVTPSPTLTSSVSVTPSVSGTPVVSGKPTVLPSATPGSFLGLTGLKQPATCSLSGSIVFKNPGLSENRNARISWQNVDIASRHINWKISPDDDLSVGPNLFVALPLPGGVQNVTVGLPNSPKQKSYRLTASVTYGQLINGNAVVKESACTGETKVILNY